METAFNRALIVAIPLVREFTAGEHTNRDRPQLSNYQQHVLVGLIAEAMANTEKDLLRMVLRRTDDPRLTHDLRVQLGES